MPQSLASIYLHIVFSTLGRAPMIADEVSGDLHAYLAATINGLGCRAVLVGGVSDHVHLLVRFGRTVTVADFVRDVKANSSSMMKQHIAAFAWQSGYGAFSFGQSQLPNLMEYVGNQRDHHREISFQDELRQLMREHQIEWDERYIWE